MLLAAQPMHAFDLDRVAGERLVVRRARPGEQLRTLDGQTRTLDEHMVLIEDADGPTSIGGIMGGARSEVQPDTRRVLLEAATWDGPNIHRTATQLGVRSEASTRFEKGLQPEQCLHAQAVASRLLVELCGARLQEGEIDLIEEVARVHGLEQIPATLPARRGAAGRLTHAQRARRAAEDALAGRGLHEIAGWSFAGPELLDRLRLPADHELRSVVRLQNPLSEAQSIMRPTLLGSLLDAARHNLFHNGPDLAIFESGIVFRES